MLVMMIPICYNLYKIEGGVDVVKRILSLMLILLLLASYAAAEEPFSLRNGYAWEVDIFDAMALAEEEGLTANGSDSLLGNIILYYADVPVGEKIAEEFNLIFPAISGGVSLEGCLYQFPPVSSDSEESEELLSYLESSLVALYGEESYDVRNGRGVIACWPLHDTLIELGDMSSYGNDTDIAKYYIRYSSNKYIKSQEPEEETPKPTTAPIKNDGF